MHISHVFDALSVFYHSHAATEKEKFDDSSLLALKLPKISSISSKLFQLFFMNYTQKLNCTFEVKIGRYQWTSAYNRLFFLHNKLLITLDCDTLVPHSCALSLHYTVCVLHGELTKQITYLRANITFTCAHILFYSNRECCFLKGMQVTVY